MKRKELNVPADAGTLSYFMEGEQGPAIVFIHGALGDARLFGSQLRHFGGRFRAIALDLPAHGRSRCDRNPGMDDFIGALGRVIAHEGVSSFVLAGHSMGGGICLEAFRRGTPGLDGLVLVSTAATLPASRELARLLDRGDRDALADMIIGSVFSKKLGLLAGLAKKNLSNIHRDVISNDLSLCAGMDYAALLPDVDVPVLVIANQRDTLVPWELSESLYDGVPNGEFIVFDDDGHVPFFENADGFNRAVDAFLDDDVWGCP